MNQRIKFTRAFTLIELMVAVAIIGILSSIVLASLTSARSKGVDSNIKASMANVRSQAEMYYDMNHTYANVCTASTASAGLNTILTAAAQKLNPSNVVATLSTIQFAYSASGAANSAVCHDSATAWAAIVSLKAPSVASAGWCMDSTGQFKEATKLGSNGQGFDCQ